MLETVLQWDQAIFKFINDEFTNAFFNWLLPILRDKHIWVPLYVFILAFLWINYKMEGLVITLFIGLTILISDQMSSSLIKHLVERERPCNDAAIQVNLLVHCGPGYSFTSSHATNHFAFSAFLASLFGRRFIWVSVVAYLWAFVISYSQIYVGVHYPFDIVGGAILGIIIGKIVGFLALAFTGFRP